MKKRKVKDEAKDEIDPIKEENPFKKPVKNAADKVESKIKRMSYKKGKTIKYIKFRGIST
jgi:hypothetical protein